MLANFLSTFFLQHNLRAIHKVRQVVISKVAKAMIRNLLRLATTYSSLLALMNFHSMYDFLTHTDAVLPRSFKIGPIKR